MGTSTKTAPHPSLAGVSSELYDIPQLRTVEASRELLASEIANEAQSTEVKEALALMLGTLKALEESRSGDTTTSGKQPDRDGSPDLLSSLTPSLIKRAVLTLVVAMSLVQPLVTNAAGSLFGGSKALEDKLDRVLVRQAEAEADATQDRRNLAQVAAFLAATASAQRSGGALPPLPPMVTLMAAMDEVERTSGQ